MRYELGEELKSITVGYTRVVHGVAVTRWSADCFEIGTLHRAPLLGLEATVERILTGK